MKNKGFTLIELLAVIVILAIIALIAVPIVLNIIKDSKESATIRSAELYMDAVNLAVTNASMNPSFPQGDVTCYMYANDPETPIPSGFDSNDLYCGSTPVKVDITGDVPTSATIVFRNGKILQTSDTSFILFNGKTYTYNSNEKLDISNNSLGTTPTVTPIGTKNAITGIVTINGEEFFDITDYVLSATDVAHDSSKYILLAKNCLNIDSNSNNYYKQDSTMGIMNASTPPTSGALAYSGSQYWTYTSGTPWIYNSSSSLYSHVEAYVDLLKGSSTTADITGRILSKGEADLLASAEGNTNILYTDSASPGGLKLNYWLGSAYDDRQVWGVFGVFSILNCGDHSSDKFFGFRPVIEISKSLIS